MCQLLAAVTLQFLAQMARHVPTTMASRAAHHPLFLPPVQAPGGQLLTAAAAPESVQLVAAAREQSAPRRGAVRPSPQRHRCVRSPACRHRHPSPSARLQTGRPASQQQLRACLGAARLGWARCVCESRSYAVELPLSPSVARAAPPPCLPAPPPPARLWRHRTPW